MNFRLHAYIANKNIIESEIDVYKFVSIIFSITPDLFCLLPRHRFEFIKKKFERYLKAYKKVENKFTRSIVYGVLLHFICDFFTAPHNFDIFSKDSDHQEYERALTKNRKQIQYLESDIFSLSLDLVSRYRDKNILSAIESILSEYRSLNLSNLEGKTPKESININVMSLDYLYAVATCSFLANKLSIVDINRYLSKTMRNICL